MVFDEDIKIAGSKPSQDIKQSKNQNSCEEILSETEMISAKQLGKKIAEKFCADNEEFSIANEEFDSQMALQRRLLLSFTASISFERYCKSDSVAGIAQKSFIDEIKNISGLLYDTSSDTGAFSFYYLAVRRGGEIERRIGQTFAMLCSHDGDPVYQELGEALYCWFSSSIEKAINELNLNK